VGRPLSGQPMVRLTVLLVCGSTAVNIRFVGDCVTHTDSGRVEYFDELRLISDRIEHQIRIDFITTHTGS
jgi:hypothetical protein